jgi:Tol biopolymer transport system component
MSDHDIDRTLVDWFHADALATVSADGVDRALAGVRRRGPRPAWLAGPGSHWGWEAPHHESRVGVRIVPRLGANAWNTLIVVAVLGALLGGALLIGARLFQAPPLPATRLGSLAYAIDGDIFVADWDGQNPVRIADGLPGGKSGCGSAGFWAEGPMWSPDGRHLAYRSPRSQVRCDEPEADTIPTVLLADPAGHVVAEFPGVGWLIPWSPDSTRVATWLDLYPSTKVGVYGVDGVRQAVLSLPPALYGTTSGDYDPTWSPDGTSIRLSAAGTSTSRAIWDVPIDGSPPHRLPAGQAQAGSSRSLSPDGARVAYVADGRLVITAADVSQVRDPERGSGLASWSPTGDRIAFVGGRIEQELRVIDVASKAETTLVRAGGGERLAVIAFAPEGDRILFWRDDDLRGTSSLWSVGPSGSDLRMLIGGVDWRSGDWQSLPADPGPGGTGSG